MKKVLPLLLALLGLGGGVAAGVFLRPAPEDPHAESTVAEDEGAQEEAADEEALPEYVKMNNQFVVPVVEDGRVRAMVVLALSLEVSNGSTEATYAREPKLRDTFLQVLFDHANVGGFNGSFTDGSNLVILRESLKEAAVVILGNVVTDVLITDIARQDG
ncbi:flagellar basal body-associated FliL family protein [Tabrizicola sp.]|uniref:flagellar basal body-associated FliL family protein n=1 Tax=Tabrizicola sp. TaxID=2005166 RepID=UPI00286D5877|nr:flagellar basal body-associated FliL family protein [Tabrizicola sp.]